MVAAEIIIRSPRSTCLCSSPHCSTVLSEDVLSIAVPTVVGSPWASALDSRLLRVLHTTQSQPLIWPLAASSSRSMELPAGLAVLLVDPADERGSVGPSFSLRLSSRARLMCLKECTLFSKSTCCAA